MPGKALPVLADHANGAWRCVAVLILRRSLSSHQVFNTMESQLRLSKQPLQCTSAEAACDNRTHPSSMQHPDPAPDSDHGFVAALNQTAEPEEAAVADHSGAAGHSDDVGWPAAGFSVPAAAVGQACCPCCYSGAALPVCYPVTPRSD